MKASHVFFYQITYNQTVLSNFQEIFYFWVVVKAFLLQRHLIFSSSERKDHSEIMSVSDRKDFYRTYSLIIFQKMRINSIACLNATRHSQSRILSFKRSVKINCREIFSRSISFSRTFAVLPAQSSFTLKLKLWGSFKRFSVEKYTQSSFKNLENSFQHKIINFKPSSTKWKAGKRLWCDENTLALLSLIV